MIWLAEELQVMQAGVGLPRPHRMLFDKWQTAGVGIYCHACCPDEDINFDELQVCT